MTDIKLKLMEHITYTVYPKKYAHGFVVLCFVVVMQSFIMNSHEVFIHIHQGCFAGTGAIVRLPQCQWSKPDGYGKISQCITTTKHSKAKPCAYFLGYTVYQITYGRDLCCHQSQSVRNILYYFPIIICAITARQIFSDTQRPWCTDTTIICCQIALVMTTSGQVQFSYTI